MTTPFNLSPLFVGYQLLNANGLPNSGGFIAVYQAGSTTPATTYTSSSGTIANPNPIQLNAAGFAPNEIWLPAGSAYKFVVTDALGNPVNAAYDNVFGINDVSVSSFSILQLAVSVASNALTATLNPTTLDFRSASLSTGVGTTQVIPAALSLMVPSGATLGTISGISSRLIWLVAYNAGSPVLCVANLSGGLNLDETTLISPTTISAGATLANIIYSASAVAANSPFRVVGFSDITETTAGTWATGPTTVQGAGGEALAGLSSLGYGQTWQSVLASRAASTTYYNTTGKPILVEAVAAVGASNQNAIALYINGLVVSLQGGQNTGYTSLSVSAIVPPGSSYYIILGATISFVSWTELR